MTARLADVLDGLPPGDAAMIETALTAAARRQLRLDRRDAALHRLWRDHFGHLSRTGAAVAIADALRAPATNDDRLHRAIRRVLDLVDGRPPGARQTLDILAGWRGW